MSSSAAKEVYDRQERICYLYNRYFVVTDNKNITKVEAGTELVSIRGLMKKIAEKYKEYGGKQLYVVEIPSLGAHLHFGDSDGRPVPTLFIDTTRDIDVKEVNEQYLTFIANHSTIREPELEFAMQFIKDRRGA